MARAAAREHVYTVTELTRNVKGILESAFQGVWVEGELSRPVYHRSGHFYGTLKDESSQLDLVMWRGQVRKLGFELEGGKQYLCFGNISVYEARGTYQLVLSKVEPAGLGALQLQFEQLKKKLADEGLFDEAHKRALPAYPQRVGIVSSLGAAGLRDILTVLKRRAPNLEILVHHAAVQGKGAAAEIARAIDVLDRLGRCDVLIVGRGGGSIEDLWAFNEEPVARAIYKAETPIISAVGHEIDYTIADFVADVRAPTPSAAAEIVAEEREAVIRRLTDRRRRLTQTLTGRLEVLDHRLAALRSRYGFQRPPQLVNERGQRLDDLTATLERAMGTRLQDTARRITMARNHLRLLSPTARLARRQEQLQGLVAQLRTLSPQRRLVQGLKDLETVRLRGVRAVQALVARREARLQQAVGNLDALSPLKVLARGYSVTLAEATGRIITEAAAVAAGDAVAVRLHRGRLHCTVDRTEDSDGEKA